MRSRAWVVVVWSGLVMGVAGLAGADCPDLVGRWPVPVQAVTAAGTTAYLGSGSTFVTLDVSNPASPSALGSLTLPAAISKIAVSGSFAYVAAGAAGLRVVDVSDPARPTEVAHVDATAYGVAVSGSVLYLAAGELRIYDVSRPAAPSLLGSWTDPNAGAWVVAISGGYAFVGGPYNGYGGGLTFGWTLAVTDPAHPSVVAHWLLDASDGPALADLAVSGQLLLVAYAGISTSGGLTVMDVSNPVAPTALGTYQSRSVSSASTRGGFAYLGDQPNDGPAGLSVISISDPRNPLRVGFQPLTAGVAGTAVSGHTVLAAGGVAGLYLFDDSACAASGCSLACTPVVPASAVAGTPVAFQGAFLHGGCTGTPTFDWDFGDGSAHSSEQNPSHAYPFGGAFHWSVAMTLGGASCTTSGTISVASNLAPITAPGAYAYVVPTSAHKAGYNGTNWVTDLVLTNPGMADSTARVYFIKGGRDNTGSPAHPVIVPLRRSLKLTDVVASTFSESSASGAIVVGSDVPLIVTSRTYNDALTGTYGQHVQGIPVEQAFGPGPSAWLTGLSQSAGDTVGFRTNIGVVNAGPQHVRVEIALYGSDGFYLGSKWADLNPYDFQQVDKVFAGLAPSGVDDGYALVSSATPGALLFAYASVIDNGTGDPIAVSAVVPPGLP